MRTSRSPLRRDDNFDEFLQPPPPLPAYPPTRSDLNREIDAVAGQLLALGWVVRRPSPCDGQDPTCLLVSREAFSPVPETVHVLAHHQLS